MSVDFVNLLFRMEDHDIIPSCLSADRHKPRDFLLHYMGCEQFFQREEYLESLSPAQAAQIQAKLQRIQHLRQAISSDGNHLVANLGDSLHAWRCCKEFQEGILRVRALRLTHWAHNGTAQKQPVASGALLGPLGKYDPDLDTYAHLIRLKNGRPVRDIADTRFHNQFPSYRISMHDLINDEESSGPMIPPAGTINYLHFPANNMFWAQKAIARYLMARPSPPPVQSNLSNGLSSRAASSEDLAAGPTSQGHAIFGQRYWRSQQQSSNVTGMFLKPMCEAVCCFPGVPDQNERSIALFMPYLHWDTVRHQDKMSQAIRKEIERHRNEKIQQERQLAALRRVRHRGLQQLNAHSRRPGTAWRLENRQDAPHHRQRSVPPTTPPKRTATGAFTNIMKRHGRLGKVQLWSAFATDDRGRVVAGTELGQVLFDAAMLFEAMATYREKTLIEKYLNEDPPLHPRRTLEQTNEWTLSLSWHSSARDQVVHRATRPKHGDVHSVDPFAKEWKERIRTIPRIMMIDQLWMWILDDQTIVTCFPDDGDLTATGNNHIPGVHKSIREAVMSSARGQLRTVYDVALLILNEVQISRASLDTVKPQDDQVHVMQIFRDAIRDVASKHSFGAEQYWEWARIFSRLAHTDIDNGLSDLIVPFLDIGKEGELQGQIKSIQRDLEIMHRITNEQKEIFEKFARTLLHLSRGRPMPDVEPTLMEIRGSMDELKDMKRSADEMALSLDYLISLKQQQVTVVQAWQSMKQGEDNQKQNLTLLVFTVVTVVFLPMSFISSVFGMNNKEIAGDTAPMTLSQQFKWMIPLSFAIVAITYYTAFGSPGRMLGDLFRWLYIKFGMYQLFAPGDLTLAGLRDRCLPSSRRRERREADEAWERRCSAQMAKDAQVRQAQAASRRQAALADSGPDTPMTPESAATPADQTGMFAIAHEMRNVPPAGNRKGRPSIMV